MSNLNIEFISTLSEISLNDWNSVSSLENPFLRYEFLHALEASNCVSRETGWAPQHLLIKDSNQALLGLMPSYLKYHSYGEYVFDWGWAEAYQRHEIPYYPKLISAIPFTPSVGPRLLIKPEYASDKTGLANLIANAVKEQANALSLSSWHILFPDEFSREQLSSISGDFRLSQRIDCQFHWHNQGYSGFEGFLSALNSRKRKNIRKERAKVQEQGIGFKHYEGSEISNTLIQIFHQFYQATYLKRGQPGYLNQQFFRLLRDTMPENLLLIMAERQGEYIAAAFFLKNKDTLYGRFWGCLDEYKHLHFETCYYQGIEYCIENKLHLFDAGAQGEHKIQRGFAPTKTYSLHWLKHPEFHKSVDDFLVQESKNISAYISEAKAYLPYKEQG